MRCTRDDCHTWRRRHGGVVCIKALLFDWSTLRRRRGQVVSRYVNDAKNLSSGEVATLQLYWVPGAQQQKHYASDIWSLGVAQDVAAEEFDTAEALRLMVRRMRASDQVVTGMYVGAGVFQDLTDSSSRRNHVRLDGVWLHRTPGLAEDVAVGYDRHGRHTHTSSVIIPPMHLSSEAKGRYLQKRVLGRLAPGLVAMVAEGKTPGLQAF